MKKNIQILASIVGAISVIYFLSTLFNAMFIGGVFFIPMDKKKIERDFEKNKEYILIVCEYLENSSYDNIYIPSTMKSGEMSNGGINIKINDDEVVKAINKLNSLGYSVISKNKTTVNFLRWSSLDSGRGIAYSIDGSEPILEFLTKLEPLSTPNWFYYEEDFNEWKMKNE